jgi:protein ImuB
MPDERLLLVRATMGKQVIACCCSRSREAGVQPAMTLAHARALLPEHDVIVREHDPQRDLAALQALAQWAIRFSPIVAPDPIGIERGEAGLLINLDGCQRVFHGERRLVNMIANAVEWLGFQPRLAVAPSFAAARALARFGRRDRCIIESHDLRDALAPLPPAALDLEDDTIDGLAEVGIERLGELFDLPRLSLPARFGSELLLKLDRAMGEAMESIEPVRPVTPPRVDIAFDGPTTQLEAIDLALQQMLDELCGELLRRESGVRKLDVQLDRSDLDPLRFDIALSHPSRNPKHLWSLLRPKVESAHLGFGIESLSMTATRLGRLRHRQEARWQGGGAPVARAGRLRRHEPDAAGETETPFGELLDTLANRIGPRRLHRFEPVESHLPQRAFRMRCALEERPRRSLAHARSMFEPAITPDPRPSLLFDRPEPIDVIAIVPDGPAAWLRWRGEECCVMASIGPLRLAAEWWRDGEARAIGDASAGFPSGHAHDYFRIQTDRGRWLWICRDLESARWFVHGEWA